MSKPSVSNSLYSGTLIPYRTSIPLLSCHDSAVRQRSAVARSFNELGRSPPDLLRHPCRRRDEFWGKPRKEPDQIMSDKDLPVTKVAGADTNGWNTNGLGDLFGRFRRHYFEDYRKGTGLFDRVRIVDEQFYFRLGPPLQAVATFLPHALRQHADMCHQRNARLDHCFNPARVAGATFKFYRLGSGGEQFARGADSLFRRVVRL